MAFSISNNMMIIPYVTTSVVIAQCSLSNLLGCQSILFQNQTIDVTYYNQIPDVINSFPVNTIAGGITGEAYTIVDDYSYITNNNTAFLSQNTGSFMNNQISIQYFSFSHGSREYFEVESPCPSAQYMDVTYSLNSNSSFLFLKDTGQYMSQIFINYSAINYGSANLVKVAG